ncbi:hypothetical protein AAHC03_026749 [Spirometra sp. Aus1]
MLEEITRAPLKPQQRLTLLKRHCVLKVLHQLVLEAVHRNTLKRLDLQVRQAAFPGMQLAAQPVRLGQSVLDFLSGPSLSMALLA